jgi:DNA mismatch endonuclease (patch repair protein)
MGRIRGRDTKPELLIRRALHARGFRYRLHDRSLPGCPDLIFRQYQAVIFIHGCFWHGHDCSLFRIPGTRPDFWKAKIEGNRARDSAAVTELNNLGWRTLNIWECSFRGPRQLGLDETVHRVVEWLTSGAERGEIRGDNACL